MRYRCIIFDFDGTLANTEEKALEIYNKLAAKNHFPTVSQEDLQKMKKMNFKELIATIEVPLAKIPKILRAAQHRMKGEMHTIQPFEANLVEHLKELKKNVDYLGIITSNTRRNVKSFLKSQGVHSFDFIVSSPLMSKQIKISAIARKYRLDKRDILYVGDESRDLEACRTAGVDSAAVSWGYNHPDTLKRDDPTYFVEEFSQLLEIVRK